MERGNTIVYRPSDSNKIEFYWVCDILDKDYLLFSWFGNPHAPSPSDYWRVSRAWLDKEVGKGLAETYEALPLEKYGDDFEQQAKERNGA